MIQEQIDTMAEALRSQGLTWSQTNFAVSLVRNAVTAERKRCAAVLRNAAARLTPAGRRANQVDMHVAHVLERKADELMLWPNAQDQAPAEGAQRP